VPHSVLSFFAREIRNGLSKSEHTPAGHSVGQRRDSSVAIASRDIARLALLKVFHLMPVPIMAEVAVVIAIPMVIVTNPSVVAVPIAFKKHSTFIPRPHPVRTRVGGPRPVPFMPLVTVAFWIPIAVYPEIIWTRGWRPNPLHTGRWRWSDSNAQRNLSAK
jgi:hypothetical protein